VFCSTFEFDLELDYPEAVLSIVRLFLLSEPEFEKAQTKGKPPKPKADGEVLAILQKVIQGKLKEYPTSIEVFPFGSQWPRVIADHTLPAGG
jgi:SET domain-containing protein 6